MRERILSYNTCNCYHVTELYTIRFTRNIVLQCTLVLFLTHIRKLQLLGYGFFDEYEYEICDDDREEINSVVYQGECFYFMGRWSS